ncbi:MAG: 30S ribosomal protein S20, partial [Patescibacteria group bacterium]|nr:30S ribosomal protein S20 [Patescibacteria group bacterium]
RNTARRVAYREAVKKAAKATGADEVKKLIREAQKALDKASKTHAIRKQTAARKLSRLMKKINKKK